MQRIYVCMFVVYYYEHIFINCFNHDVSTLFFNQLLYYSEKKNLFWFFEFKTLLFVISMPSINMYQCSACQSTKYSKNIRRKPDENEIQILEFGLKIQKILQNFNN